MFNSKKSELSTGWIIAIAVAVVLVLDIGGAGTWVKEQVGIGAPAAPVVTQVPVSPGQAAKCYIEDTTVSVGPAEKRYKPTTKATTSYHNVVKNGVDKGKYLDGSTLTANPGDKLQILYAINDSQNPTKGYYSAKQIFTVPCVGEVTTAEAPDSDAYQLFASDSNNLTVQVFNWDDGDLNQNLNNNMTLGAGDKKSNKFNLFGTYQEGFSPYGKICVVVSANSSTYQKFAVGDYPSITAPTHFKGPASMAADAYTWAFELPGIRSNEEISTTLYVEVKSTPGDATVLATGGNQIHLFFIDQDWYQHTVTGEFLYGYEDNDYTDVGVDDFNTSLGAA